MKLLSVSCHKHFMDHNFNAEPSAAMKFNEVILKQFERPCQIFGVQIILTKDPKIDLMETVENKYYALQPGVTFGPADVVKSIELSKKTFKSRQNFHTTINDEIMSNKVALMVFKLDGGFIEISGDENGECEVVMHLVPKKTYAPDYKSTHGGVFNIFTGKSFVNNIEFLPDKKGLIISFQKPSNMIYGNGKSKPDSVWQEKHEIINGILVHTETRYGTHHPQETVQEHITWEQEWNKVTQQ